MPYLKRHLESTIQNASQFFSSIWISGPRQSGKTTMLRHLAEEEKRGREYINLENPRVQAEARADPKGFLQQHHPPLILDEIQHVLDLLPYIKITIDAHRTPGDFWLTSSVLFPYLPSLPESLAGRVAVQTLYPLSQREITGAPCVPFFPEEQDLLALRGSVRPANTATLYARIGMGSLPERVSRQSTKRDQIYAAFLESCIRQDVQYLSPGIDVPLFLRFLQAAAKRCAKPLQCNLLADKTGIDTAMAERWIQLLIAAGIAYLVYPDYLCRLPHSTRKPRLYFLDTGLVCYLASQAPSKRDNTSAWQTQLLENYAISEIVKGYAGAGSDYPDILTYCRPPREKELNFLMQRNGVMHPVLIRKERCEDPETLFQALGQGSFPRGTGAVLSADPAWQPLPRDNWAVPIWML